MPESVLELTEQTFDSLIRDSEQPVLVDFWAPWCMPCRVVGQTIEALAPRFADRVRIAKLNIDEAPEVASRLKITAIPTLMIFRDGQPVDTLVGVQPEEKIVEAIDNAATLTA